jgi:xanthine dehydrogenase YagS FAD-binding subunit
MKENVEHPSQLIDHHPTAAGRDPVQRRGKLRLGARSPTNTDVAYHPDVERRLPAPGPERSWPGAVSAATQHGLGRRNLMHGRACQYFYDTATPCNKREPGTGARAIDGDNRSHA